MEFSDPYQTFSRILCVPDECMVLRVSARSALDTWNEFCREYRVAAIAADDVDISVHASVIIDILSAGRCSYMHRYSSISRSDC